MTTDYGGDKMTDTKISKYEDTKIMQPYKVTMARHEFSAIEMRIMALVIYRFKEAQLEWYSKDFEDLPDNFNKVTINQADIVVSDNHGDVREALESLTKRGIKLKKDKATYFFNLVREASYSDDRSTIKINVSPNILPELIAIGNNYTKFGLDFLFKTKSTYAIQWYQIGCHWLQKGVFYISKDEIRELFKAQNKYKKHVNFHSYLITNPLKEVNKKSDITIKITETHKNGRSIVGYTISVTSKNPTTAIEEEITVIKLPKMLEEYMLRKSSRIKHQADKCNYDSKLIRKKLEDRGVPDNTTNQSHFDNMTDKYIATILVKDGQTNLSVEEMLREIKS